MRRICLRLFLPLLSFAAVGGSESIAQGNAYDVPETLDLPTALSFALENNFEILKAKQRIEEQNGLILEVRAQALPEVTLDGRYVELDEGLSEGNAFFPATKSQWTLGLNARQTLYAGGGVRAALNVQKLIEESALLELQAVISDALLQTREGFYLALLARARIQVQEESVQLLEQQLQNAKDRFEVGTVSNFEVLRAEVELANARPALISARNQYRIAVEELRQILGFVVADPNQMSKVPEFAGELEYQPAEYDLASSLEAAMAERPELLRLQKVIEAREEGVVIARSDRLPELNLIGSYQANRSSFSSSFDDRLEGWTAGLEVRVPIFDGHRARGRILQARSQRELAVLDFRQLALAVEVDVRRAFSDLQEAGELADASIKVVGQADESLRLADARYVAGEATQLDVLQARVSLTEARLNQLEAYYRYNVAEARVRRSIGLADPFVRLD